MKKRLLFVLPVLTLLSGALAGCGQQDSTPEESTFSSSEYESVSSSTNSIGSSDSSSSSAESSAGEEIDDDESKPDIVYEGKLRIYYHRDDMTYEGLAIYLWNQSVNGVEYAWTGVDPEYGAYFDIDLANSPQFKEGQSTDIRLIIKKVGTWSGQSDDTICEFKRFNSIGDTMMIYTVQGENSAIEVYKKREDALGDYIASCKFASDWKTILVKGGGTPGGREDAEVGKIHSWALYGFSKDYYRMSAEDQVKNLGTFLLQEGEATTNSISITLENEARANVIYEVRAIFESNLKKVKSKTASMSALYDTENFTSKYTYTGSDLGVTYSETGLSRTYKLWCPTAARVQLRLYQAATPMALVKGIGSGSDNFYQSVEMTSGLKGTWSGLVKKSDSTKWNALYYTFYVTHAGGSYEVADPYNPSSTVNASRSAALDLASGEGDPENWKRGAAVDEKLPAIQSANNLTVYEAHIRDLTADKTWVSNQGNLRGTYNAFCEEGTTYTKDGVTVKTGFDHIKEMGVNAVQLLPVFDQANDERPHTVYDSLENGGELDNLTFNWGYNPANYNSVEGAYASDPYSATSKMKEFKNLVLKYSDAGIRIIMDVVYNHMGSVANNYFTKMMPGYYFRTDAKGAYTDGSGCGNEIASERPMVSKFIVDSVCFYAKEYRIKGFRFDLMGCLDLDTMKAVRTALNEIDPSIVVYGEGWTGGGTALSGSKQSSTNNVYRSLNTDDKFPVGCFNDAGRDGTKGNTSYGDVTPNSGFMNESYPSSETIYNCLTQIIGENRRAKPDGGCNPNQTVNYVACHDNYTLYDQINYQLHGKNSLTDHDDAKKAALAAQSIALFGQGIGFLQGGDELFRQKLITKGDENFDILVESYKHATNGKDSWIEGDGVKLNEETWLVRNSYKYGDKVNAFKWDRKVDNLAYCQKFADVVALRNSEMGKMLGKSLAEIKGKDGIGGTDDDGAYCWNYQDLPEGSTILAGGFQNAACTEACYIFLGGNMSSSSGTKGIGNGNVTVLYSSDSHYKAGQTISITDYKISVDKFECLIVRR